MTAETDNTRLDAALARWATASRLPADRGTEMLTTIMSTPAPEVERRRRIQEPALGRGWWRDHSASLAATLVASAKGVPAVA